MFRTEKDNVSIKHEIEEIKVVSDEVTRAKVKDVFVFRSFFLGLFLVVAFLRVNVFRKLKRDVTLFSPGMWVSSLSFSRHFPPGTFHF